MKLTLIKSRLAAAWRALKAGWTVSVNNGAPRQSRKLAGEPPSARTNQGTLSTRVNREFSDLSRDREVTEEDLYVMQRLGHSSFDWNELLRSKRVLIISEAGSGKTFECRARRDTLWDAGEPAFFLELASLAASQVRDMLSGPEIARLDSWKGAQSGDAYFFLDSIDELRLTLASFEQALVRLGREVGCQLARTRIIITTRPIPLDEKLIRRHLPVPSLLNEAEQTITGMAYAEAVTGTRRKKSDGKVNDSAPPEWRNVSLLPLSDAQIRQIAAANGVTDVNKFMDDVERQNSHEFVRHPQDLIELCAAWIGDGLLNTHAQQVAASIAVKLKPSKPGDLAPLSTKKAFEGASRLALAVLLTRKLTIKNSGAAEPFGPPALDAAVVLADWSEEERYALIQRPLFGFSSYGRVRFVHRSVVEFLAAKRLIHFFEQGVPERSIRRIIFTTTVFGVSVVRPSLRPVAAWLATENDAIYSRLRDLEPETLVNFGDPGTLTAVRRGELLRRLVHLYGNGGSRGMRLRSIQVRRLASPDLAHDIAALWKEQPENPDVRELLIELCGVVEASACSELCFAVALDNDASSTERVLAINALISASDSRLRDVAEDLLQNEERWPSDVANSVTLALFPRYLDGVQFCRLLQRYSKHEDPSGFLRWSVTNRITTMDIGADILQVLLREVKHSIASGLSYSPSWPHYRTSIPALTPVLIAICLAAWRGEIRSEQLTESTVLALRVLTHENDHDSEIQQLQELLRELPAVERRQLFWVDEQFVTRLHSADSRWDLFYELAIRGPIRLHPEQDSAWVLSDLRDVNVVEARRALMLETAMYFVPAGELWISKIAALGEAVNDSLTLKCWRALKIDHLCSLKIDQGMGPRGLPLGVAFDSRV